jgi:hypothetical protein
MLLLSTCEEFDPQWNGVWVDDTSVPNVVITLDFSKWSGILTVENSDAAAVVEFTRAEGSLDGDEKTIIATITSIYQKYKDGSEVHITDPLMIYLYITTMPHPIDCPGCLGLEYPCSATYKIEGDTITLTGTLILAVTGNVADTLVATKQS